MHLLSILYSIYIILYSFRYYVILFCCLLLLLDICGLTVVSTFARATCYIRPHTRDGGSTAFYLRCAARLDIEQGPPEKPCKAPVFDLQCNVSYVASLEPGNRFLLSRKRQGGGQGRSPKSTLAKILLFHATPFIVMISSV